MNETVGILKLSTGEELISQVVVEPHPEVAGAQVLKLVAPCAIQRIEGPDGQVSARFAPIAVYTVNQTIQISQQHVVYTAEPEEGFLNAYLQLIGKAPAILTPPEKKLIVPQL